jgi:hypothetical protein
MKLNEAEKQHICDTLEKACGGTPLQPNAEFAGGYLGQIVINLMQDWDRIRKALAEESKGNGNTDD